MVSVTASFLALFCQIFMAHSAQAQRTQASPQRDQQKTISRSNIPRFFPLPPDRIVFMPPPTVKIPLNEKPIEIKKMAVSVVVTGLEAETSTLITFHNPNGRLLEGEIQFPLPDGASVTGYVLDVGGKMIDGVIVSKEKARVVLETETRRQVDPGIVEKVRGNAFRTRLYPIPGLGERTIRITSVSSLKLLKQDAVMQISLPVGARIPKLDVEIQVNRPPIQPEIGGFGNLTFKNWGHHWSAKTSLTDVLVDNDIFINVPKLPAQVVNVERNDDEFFVAINDKPNVAKVIEPIIPTSITVAWDGSGSRTRESVRKDREWLEELFTEWKNVTVRLIVFRDRVETPVTIEIKNSDTSKLMSLLDQVAYDGATDLSALDFRSSASSKKREQFFLFTDGFGTIGNGLPKFDSAPIYVVGSNPLRDSAFQKFLAQATGGTFIDLSIMDAKQAVQLVVRPPLTLLRVENERGILSDVQTEFVASAGRASVYAKLNSEGEVHLIYGNQGRELARSTVRVTKANASEGKILARAWASAYANDLSVFADENQKELLDLGRRYQIVTTGTSLIVLENVNQYLEHEIEPPATMPNWRQEYFAALKNRSNQLRTTEEQKIQEVVEMWKKRVSWWETKFPDKPPALGLSFGGSGGSEGSRAGAPPSPQSMASPPMPPPPRGSSDDGDSAMELSSAEMAAPAPGESSKKRGNSADSGATEALIQIKEWNPTTPYMTEIETKGPEKAYATYLEQKKAYGTSPAFYLDCANYFFKRDRAIALRVLSNLAELNLENSALLRVFAWRLLEAGELDRAIETFARVRSFRPEEPQSHRDLALAYMQRLDRDKRIDDGVRAAELFNQVIKQRWQRFPEVELIVLMELNRLLENMKRIDPSSMKKLSFIDKRLLKLLDLDVRITMSWDADNTDMDLHVIEPSGEEAYYGHRETGIGGLVSRDITDGYGPEEYVIKKAMPGGYKILCKYFGSREQTLMGPVTVTAKVITNFGRANEKSQLLTLRLTGSKDMVEVGTISIGKNGSLSPDATPKKVTRAKIQDLKKQMTKEAVTLLLGEPERREGGSIVVLLYRLENGNQVRLGFGPNLMWAREVLDNAEQEIVLRQ